VRQPTAAGSALPAAQVGRWAPWCASPGERVPLDGVVTKGTAPSTRRPSPARASRSTRRPATRCSPAPSTRRAALEFASPRRRTTTLARIIHAVEQAQGTRAPTQRFVDRFAAVYTPAVFALAVAVALLGPGCFGWTWLQALYKALVLLVIACPCALVISTPVTVVSGLAAAARAAS
jgi:Cd2+/Zn2+-exporting ATPase